MASPLSSCSLQARRKYDLQKYGIGRSKPTSCVTHHRGTHALESRCTSRQAHTRSTHARQSSLLAAAVPLVFHSSLILFSRIHNTNRLSQHCRRRLLPQGQGGHQPWWPSRFVLQLPGASRAQVRRGWSDGWRESIRLPLPEARICASAGADISAGNKKIG